MATDGDPDRADRHDRGASGAGRTPEQQRRAAERARRIRERRAAERAGDTATADRTGHSGPGRTRSGPDRSTGGRGGPDRPGDPRRRRRRTLAVLATVLVLLIGLSAGAWWALGRFGPAVHDVEVTGTRQIPARDVSDAAGVEPGTPLAAVDTDAVTARVAAIPGVASVEVGRSWPHTLTVTVAERTPVALVEGPGGRRIVDVTGYPYRPAPPDAAFPVLALPRVAPDDPATAAAVGMLQALPQPVRDQVRSVGFGPGGTTFELVLTDDRRVLWGPWSDAAAVQRRAAVLGPLLTREGTVYDVSSPELATVRQD
ncbi:cell division protein FtsQ/DivIB [Pseudonocardia nantongensis]|uniref:cell division protein FtsQ/DivIB n=1 Tax=Pseudonocardia nantongensis TaxID=1181885 RepID=UPI003977E72A